MVNLAHLTNAGLEAGDHAHLQPRSRFNGFPDYSTTACAINDGSRKIDGCAKNVSAPHYKTIAALRKISDDRY